MSHFKALLIFAAGLAASSYLTYLVVSRPIPLDETAGCMVIANNEPDQAKAKAEREAEVNRICAKDPLACKIMRAEWRGKR